MHAHGHKPGAQASGAIVVFVDGDEAVDLLLKEGGRTHRSDKNDKISDSPYEVRLNGRRVSNPVVPSIMGMERDKASELMQNAADAVAIRARRAAIREVAEAERDAKFIDAERRRSATFHRQEGAHEGQPMRSILASTSKGGDDPASQWEDAIITYKGDDGGFHAGTESWDGEMSEPDEHGDSHRVGVKFVPFKYDENCQNCREPKKACACGSFEKHPDAGQEYTFLDEKHAHRTIKLMLMEGQFEGYDRKDPTYRDRIGKRLREWSHRDDAFARQEDGRARLHGARLDSDEEGPIAPAIEAEGWDFRYTAEIGAEQSLRSEVRSAVDLATGVQLDKSTAHDSE